jgi:hypothetical protein
MQHLNVAIKYILSGKWKVERPVIEKYMHPKYLKDIFSSYGGGIGKLGGKFKLN